MSRPPRSPNPLAAAWARLGARERRLAALAATVVGLALLWWLGLAPALRTLREADSQRAALQVQAQQMQRLKTEAEALKALPRLSRDEALRALEAAVKQRWARRPPVRGWCGHTGRPDRRWSNLRAGRCPGRSAGSCRWWRCWKKA